MTIYYVEKTGNDANGGAPDRPFATIGRAITIASNGDTIHVGKGRWSEELLITKMLEIVGEPDETIIDGSMIYPTITNSALSALVYIAHDDVVLRNLHIINSRASGVSASYADNIELDNLTVLNPARYGIYLNVCGYGTVSDSIIRGAKTKTDNAQSDRAGAGLELRECSQMYVLNTTVCESDHQGIGLIECAAVTVDGCVLYDNLGTQLYIDGLETGEINANEIFYTENVLSTNRAIGIHIARDVYPLGSGATADYAVPNQSIDITNNIVVGCQNNLVHRGGFATVYKTVNGTTVSTIEDVPGYKWDDIRIFENTFVNGIGPIIIEKERDNFIFGTSGDTVCILSNNIIHSISGTPLQWKEEDISTYQISNNIFSSNPSSYSKLKSLSGCLDCIVADPVLVNRTAKIKDYDSWDPDNYKLKQSSPGVDSGNNSYYNATDLWGTGRPVNYLSDIGAHEYTSGSDWRLVAGFSADVVSGAVPLEVQFTDKSYGSKAIVSWAWSFGDGTVSSERHPRHIYNKAGLFTVTLTVKDAQGLSSRYVNNDMIFVDYDGTSPSRGSRNRIESARLDIGYNPAYGSNITPHGMTYKPSVAIVTMRHSASVVTVKHAIHSYGFIKNDSDGYYSVTSQQLLVRNDTADLEMRTYLHSVDGAGVILWKFDGASTGETGIEIAWDETNVTVSEYSGATDSVPYTVQVKVLLLGGPDLKYQVDTAQVNSHYSYIPYDSGDIGFRPDILLGIQGSDISLPDRVFEYGVGVHDGYNNASIKLGTRNDVTASTWEISGKFRTDRFLSSFSEDISKDSGGMAAEFNDSGYKVFSTPSGLTYLIGVLALNFGDLNFDVLAHSRPEIATETQMERYLGWEPGTIFGHTSWMNVGENYVDQYILAFGDYMNDGVSETNTCIYALTPDTLLAHAVLSSPSMHPSGYTEYTDATLAINEDGYTITYAAGSRYTAGDILIAIERGSIEPIEACFSVNKLTGYTNTDFRITDITYDGDIDDLEYLYTWTGGGSSTEKNPVIQFSTVGTKTITQTVTSASNSNITDTYSVNVTVGSTYIIPKISVSTENAGGIASVGSFVVFSDDTIPTLGATITSRSFRLYRILDDGSEQKVLVASANDDEWEWIPQEPGRYVLYLDVAQDDGKSGSVEYAFNAQIALTPGAAVTVQLVAGVRRAPEKTTVFDDGVKNYYTNYVAPATFKISDESDLREESIISRQIIIAPYEYKNQINLSSLYELVDIPLARVGELVIFSGKKQIEYTFASVGFYTICLLVRTTGGASYVYYDKVISVEAAEKMLIGPPTPGDIGPASMNVIDGFGKHYHKIDTTVNGEPSKIVITDSHGGIRAQYFEAIGPSNDDGSPIKDGGPSMGVTGEIVFNGTESGISGERITVNTPELLPTSPDGVNVGSKAERFNVLYAGQLDAGQFAQSGNTNAVGGSVYIGVSYRLLREVAPGDREIIINNGSQLNSGDYLYFSRENTVELMRVSSNPTTVSSSDDTWLVAVLRGAEVGSGFSSSHWYYGDVLLNTGGSADQLGSVTRRSWLEILADESIRSRLDDPGLAEGPVMHGSLRYGPGPMDWFGYFSIGRLDGMYGIPEDTHTVGAVFGPDVDGSACLFIGEDGITVFSRDNGVAYSFTNDGGFEITISDEESARQRGIAFVREDGADAVTINMGYDNDNRDGRLLISSLARSGWVTGVHIETISPDGRSAGISVESELGLAPQIKLYGIPTSDPGENGALWNDSGTLRISS